MGRYLGLGKEGITTYGTAVAPSTYLRILGETIKWDPNFTYHRTVEGGRRLQTAIGVKQMSKGGIRFMPVYDKGLGEILSMLFGKWTTTNIDVGVRWQHVFEPLTTLGAGTPPSYTLEKGLDDITAERYPGCSIGRLKISANAADFLLMNADIFGKKPTTQTLAAPTFSALDYLNAGQVVTQTLAGVTAKFEQFSVDIVGGAVPAFKPGNTQPDSIDIEPVMVTASFVTRFLSSADLTDFLNAVQKALVYKWQGPTLGTGNYSLQIDLPKLNFDEGDVVVNEQERLVQARSVTALEDPVNGLIKMTLNNGVSAY